MDRYGPRRLLALACVCSVIGTYLFAGSHSIAVAQFGRFLVGFGAAFAFVGALKLATIWLPPNRFALISGLITSLGMIGAMAGDILLRGLVDDLGWKMTTYTTAGAGIILAIAIWAVVRDVNPSPTHPHYHVQRMHFHDLLRGLWGALRNPQIWFNGMIGFLLYLSLSAFAELWGIPYLEQARGLSRMHAANANAMIFLGWAIGGPCWGLFSDLLCVVVYRCGSVAPWCICVILYFPQFLMAMSLLLFYLAFIQRANPGVAICRELHYRIAGTAIL